MHVRIGPRIATLLIVLGFLGEFVACRGDRDVARSPAVPASRRVIEDRTPRDVLLVTLDTLRHDAPGYSNGGHAATPILDRVAADGVSFATARAHAVVTLPSHASMLTGLYPYQHGIRDNAGFVLDRGVPTLASVLRAAGYETAAFVSAFPLDRRFGLDTGFDVYDDRYEGRSAGAFTLTERSGDETVALAKEWWDARRGRRRFMWVHLFTPHFPYDPPEPYASRHSDEPYYGDVEWCDAQLRPLLEPFLDGGEPPALVVVTADHGESLGEHGEQTHGLFAYEATLRVPLVFWDPGRLLPGQAVESARHVDLMPSVLDLLGIAPPPSLPGRSLFLEPSRDADQGSYFEALSAALNRGWAPLYGRVEGELKVVRLPIPELYDLERDPHEKDNAVERRPADFRLVASRIPEAASEPVGRGAIDDDTVARLRALGYSTAAEGATSGTPADRSRDPKKLFWIEPLLDGALASYREGEIEAAVAALRGLIEREPRMTVAYSHLGFIYQAEGRTSDVIELLTRARSLGLDDPALDVRLALALVASGRPAEAREVLGGGAERSLDPIVHSALGRIAAALAEPDRARRHFERALEIDPTFPEAQVDLGVLALSLGDTEEARVRLEQALAADPLQAEGWNALGVVHLRNGSLTEAAEAWQRAVGIDPGLSDALFNLALVFGRAGEHEKAIRTMKRFVAITDGDERRRGQEMLSLLQSRARGGG